MGEPVIEGDRRPAGSVGHHHRRDLAGVAVDDLDDRRERVAVADPGLLHVESRRAGIDPERAVGGLFDHRPGLGVHGGEPRRGGRRLLVEVALVGVLPTNGAASVAFGLMSAVPPSAVGAPGAAGPAEDVPVSRQRVLDGRLEPTPWSTARMCPGGLRGCR